LDNVVFEVAGVDVTCLEVVGAPAIAFVVFIGANVVSLGAFLGSLTRFHAILPVSYIGRLVWLGHFSPAMGHVIFPLPFVHFAVSMSNTTSSLALILHPVALIDTTILVVFDSLAIPLVSLIPLTPISIFHPTIACIVSRRCIVLKRVIYFASCFHDFSNFAAALGTASRRLYLCVQEKFRLSLDLFPPYIQFLFGVLRLRHLGNKF